MKKVWMLLRNCKLFRHSRRDLFFRVYGFNNYKKIKSFRCTYKSSDYIYSLLMPLNKTYTLTCTFIKLLIKGCRNVVAICKLRMNETEKGFVDRKSCLWCFDFFWSINCVLTFTNLTYSHSITNHTNEWCGKHMFFLSTWIMP